MSDQDNKAGEDQGGQMSPLEQLTGVSLPHMAEDPPAPGRRGSSAGGPRHGSGVSLWFVGGLVLAAVAVAYIILDGADDAVFAYTVDQAVEQQEQLVGKQFRVRGKVEEGSVIHVPGTLDTTFKIKHGTDLMTITYNKPLPDTFKAGIEVIAEGKMGQQGTLVADNVIAKCPSKYEEGAPGSEEHPAGAGGY